MSPGYLPLYCSRGECGHIVSGSRGGSSSSQCPSRCSIHEQCSVCLGSPGCGWCAFGGLNGRGVCMEGGMLGPKYGLCNAENVTLGREPMPGMLYFEITS